jgi:hypothetical protein
MNNPPKTQSRRLAALLLILAPTGLMSAEAEYRWRAGATWSDNGG